MAGTYDYMLVMARNGYHCWLCRGLAFLPRGRYLERLGHFREIDSRNEVSSIVNGNASGALKCSVKYASCIRR